MIDRFRTTPMRDGVRYDSRGEPLTTQPTPAELGTAMLQRNVLIEDEYGFKGQWVAVPREDFDTLRAFLAAAADVVR